MKEPYFGPYSGFVNEGSLENDLRDRAINVGFSEATATDSKMFKRSARGKKITKVHLIYKDDLEGTQAAIAKRKEDEEPSLVIRSDKRQKNDGSEFLVFRGIDEEASIFDPGNFKQFMTDVANAMSAERLRDRYELD